MVKINLKIPADIAKEANEIKYTCNNEQKNSFFMLISERFKALFLLIKL